MSGDAVVGHSVRVLSDWSDRSDKSDDRGEKDVSGMLEHPGYNSHVRFVTERKKHEKAHGVFHQCANKLSGFRFQRSAVWFSKKCL